MLIAGRRLRHGFRADAGRMRPGIIAFKPGYRRSEGAQVRVYNESITDTVVLTDSGAELLVQSVTDTVVIVETITLGLVLNFSVTDVVALKDGALGLADHFAYCDAENPDALTNLSTFSIYFPPTSPSSTVVLKVPQFDDTRNLKFGKVVRRTMGGKLSIAQGFWNQWQVFDLSFKVMPEQMKIDLETFVTTYAGKEIGWTDQDGLSWRGVILTTDFSSSLAGIGCQFEAKLMLRGVRA